MPRDLREQRVYEVAPGAGGRREVQLVARIALEPAFHRRRLVSAVVVDDEVQVEMGGGVACELFQERQELLGAVAGQAFADELAGCHIEGGETRAGSAAVLIMRPRAAAALSEGQCRVRTSER